VPRVQRYLDAKGAQELLRRGEMINLARVEWKGTDNMLHLLVKFSDRMQKHHMNHSEYSQASFLITPKLTASPFVSSRLKGYIKQYNSKYRKLVQALSYGWNSVENFKALHSFIKQENK